MSQNKIKFSVGIFVLTITILISIFLFFLFKEKGVFEKRYTFHFISNSSSSFNIGMPLKFSGFNIGVIDKIKLLDNGAVDIIFSVNEKNRKWITLNSVLVIIKPLIGVPHIEVCPSFDSPLLDVDSTLLLVMSDDINDVISKFEPSINKLINIVNNINILTDKLAKDDSNFLKTLKNIEQLTKKLATNNSLLTSITGDEKSTKNLVNSLNLTTNVMKDILIITKQLNKIASSLDKTIINKSSTILNEVEISIKDINKKLRYLDNTVKVVGSYDNDLISIKEQISVGLEKSNHIIEKVDSLFINDSNNKVVLP